MFPLATPLLAGPGAMTSAIVLAAGTKGDFKLLGAVVVAILAVMAVTLMLLLVAQEIHQLIGRHGAEGDRAGVRRAARGARRAVDLQRPRRHPYIPLRAEAKEHSMRVVQVCEAGRPA